MEQPIFTVSQLIAVVNQTLEYAYPTVFVEGEVSSFKVSKSKYVFFDVKDDAGAVGCFMMIYQLRMPLEDGMKVRLIAQPRLTAWGKFSLNVREVMPVGEGSIKRAFDILKSKLQSDGLFDTARKRLLPKIPQSIGLIASAESAGYADFIKIVNHRWRGLQISVADVQVQGVSAADQIIAAIDFFNQQAELPEVLVIVRGGGSAEDLAVFNDEALVRAVAASRIPTLVGVGHEVDTSLCDLAADVRAATPSNAAQILVPDQQDLLRDIAHQERHLLERVESRVADMNRWVSDAGKDMLSRLEHTLGEYMQALRHAEATLKQLDPKVVLSRGYALVRDTAGKLVKGTAANIKAGDKLTVTTAGAIIDVGVNHVRTQKNPN